MSITAAAGHYFGAEALLFFRATGASLNRCRGPRTRRPRRGRRHLFFLVPPSALQHITHATRPYPGQTLDSQVSAVARSPDTEVAAPAVPSPPPAQLERLNPSQRSSFPCVWARHPPHLREIAFDLHDPGWDPPAIEKLGDLLCDFPGVFSTSKTDFGS